MAEILFGELAEEEYTAALCWYAERNPRAADRFETEMSRSLEMITAHPQRYPRCDAQHRFFLLKHYPYQIIYRLMPDQSVLIVAIAHTSRKPGYWSNR